MRLCQFVVEPILLTRAHHRAPCVIGDLVNVVGVGIDVGYIAVILTSVKHDQVEESADAKATPNSQIVIHFDLTDWHPLKVGTNSIHLSLIDTDATILDERLFIIEQSGRACFPCIVRHFVVVPDWDPRVLLMAGKEVFVSTVSGNSLAVIVERINSTVWKWNAVNRCAVAVVTILVFIDVVAKVDDIVYRLFTNRVAVGIEKTEC